MCGGTWPPLHGELSPRTNKQFLLDAADDLIDAAFGGWRCRRFLMSAVRVGSKDRPAPRDLWFLAKIAVAVQVLSCFKIRFLRILIRGITELR
jgi:hypothetical protein